MTRSNNGWCTLVGVAVIVAGAGCRKAAVPGQFDQFLAPMGSSVPPVCTAAADGNRYTLTGYARLPTTLRVTGSDSTIEFAQELEGRTFQLAVKVPDQVQVQAVGSEQHAAGYRATRQDIDPTSFRMATTNGEATATDRVQIIVALEVIQHFQTHAVTGCYIRLVSASKVR